MPPEAFPPFEAIVSGTERLPGHASVPVALACIYGGPQFGYLDEGGDEPASVRYPAIHASIPAGGAPALLRILDRFPSGAIDPVLVARTSREAR